MFVTSQVSMPAASGLIHVNKQYKKTLGHALYNTVTYKIQVNNFVLCSWHGELPLCWCQAIQ